MLFTNVFRTTMKKTFEVYQLKYKIWRYKKMGNHKKKLKEILKPEVLIEIIEKIATSPFAPKVISIAGFAISIPKIINQSIKDSEKEKLIEEFMEKTKEQQKEILDKLQIVSQTLEMDTRVMHEVICTTVCEFLFLYEIENDNTLQKIRQAVFDLDYVDDCFMTSQAVIVNFSDWTEVEDIRENLYPTIEKILKGICDTGEDWQIKQITYL